MTPRPTLVLAAALASGLVAAACSQSPPEATEASPTDDTESVGTADAEATCREEQAELDRRDEAGTIDWEAIEGSESEDEPTEEELASVMIERERFPADVAAAGERPAFPDFPDRLDVAELSDEELVEAVDVCYEVGVLADEDGEEAGDD